MFTRRTDRDWQVLGQVDPYWAVLTDERYGKDRLSAETLREFFASGEAHVASIFELIRRHVQPAFQPASALDFGCGVGRILIPLACQCESVMGVDVAPAMLAEARTHCTRLGLRHVRLVVADDALSAVDGMFEFIHSYIVFQHIPPARGVVIARRLLEHLQPGGVGALHFTYRNEAIGSKSRRDRWRATLKASRVYPLVRAVRDAGARLASGWRWPTVYRPPMQMNCYDLNLILAMLQQAGVRQLHIELRNDEGMLGALLLFRKEDQQVAVSSRP